jgi:hypothetical protein
LKALQTTPTVSTDFDIEKVLYFGSSVADENHYIDDDPPSYPRSSDIQTNNSSLTAPPTYDDWLKSEIFEVSSRMNQNEVL